MALSDCPYFLVPRNQLQSVAAACKVLIEFSLLRLENPDEACAVSQVRAESLFLALILKTEVWEMMDGWYQAEADTPFLRLTESNYLWVIPRLLELASKGLYIANLGLGDAAVK